MSTGLVTCTRCDG